MHYAAPVGLLCLIYSTASPAHAQQAPFVWTLDRLDHVGGHVPEVLGRPSLVDTPHGKALAFDGTQDALFLDTNPLAGLAQFTVEVIFQPSADGSKEQRFLHFQEEGSENRLLFETRLTAANRWFLDTFIKSGDGNYTLYADRFLHALGPWYHAAVTVDGKTMRHYVNGSEELSTPIEFTPQRAGRTSIGVRINKVHWFKGAIRQIRISPIVVAPSDFLKP